MIRFMNTFSQRWEGDESSEGDRFGMNERLRVHIRDVAKHAGVSLGTVSNVLNEKDFVADHLVDRVRRSMVALGYVPNDNARRLKSQVSETLAMLVLSSYNSFFHALADAAEEEADALGFDLILANSAQRSEREDKYLRMFERQRVAGVILAPINGVTATAEVVRERGTPVVLLGETSASNFDTVRVDTEVGGYLAVQHLVSQGRRRLLGVGGPEFQVRERLAGARRAASEDPRVELRHLPTADLTLAEGERVASFLLDLPSHSRPDGIFAFNDLVAIGLLNRLSVGGVDIPNEISIVGHDDIEFATMTATPLTTIRQPVQEIARAAVGLAVERAAGEGSSVERRVFVPELIVRHTSLPLPSS